MEKLTASIGPNQSQILANILDLRHVYVWKSDFNAANLSNTDNLRITPLPDERLLVEFINPIQPQGSLTAEWPTGTVRLLDVRGTDEVFSVPFANHDRVLTFARIFWKGYQAMLDGVRINTSSWRNALLSIHLPAGTSGTLTITYRPISSEMALFSAALGALLVVGAGFSLGRQTIEDGLTK
jgi:hypothetical protein